MGKEFSSLICVYAVPGVTVRKCLQLEPFSFSVFLANILANFHKTAFVIRM